MSLSNDPSLTNAQQIGLQWTPGASEGGTPVLDYRLFFDQGVGTWMELETGITSTDYLVTSLLADTIY